MQTSSIVIGAIWLVMCTSAQAQSPATMNEQQTGCYEIVMPPAGGNTGLLIMPMKINKCTGESWVLRPASNTTLPTWLSVQSEPVLKYDAQGNRIK